MLSNDSNTILKARGGNREAMNAVILSLQPLIAKIANGFAAQYWGFEPEDLIQEGLLACRDAIRWFKPELGFKLTTYAADCARRRIWKHIQKDGNRPLPTFGDETDLASLNKQSACHRIPKQLPKRPGTRLESTIAEMMQCMNDPSNAVKVRQQTDEEIVAEIKIMNPGLGAT